ncbi:hypothetical protein G5I_00066 [Acromyrmex echinatior]|uniref:DUF4817 domain-containing protein n=1 Tax=Acromyrmex echinatior TaxID=103372 RepID=F4W3W5_ACREC|nr:hypothetical protein G5I_00066 [Acromyrmex echinatior]
MIYVIGCAKSALITLHGYWEFTFQRNKTGGIMEQQRDEYRDKLLEFIRLVQPIQRWAIYWYVFEFRRMATPNELQTRNFDSLLVIPSAARNNMFSLEERFEILKTYFQSQCCVAETVRILKRNMGRDRAPTDGAIRKLVRKVREKGMLVDDIILRLF